MTTVEEATNMGDVETVGSAGVSRRIYGYTLPGKDSQPWSRSVGGTNVTGVGLIKVGDTTKADVLVS